MRFREGIFILALLVFVLSSVSANEILLSSLSNNFTQGDNFDVFVLVNVTEGDLHSLQFDVTYNPSILTLNSIIGGDFLSSDGAEVIFDYESFGSGLADDVYLLRNKTFLDFDQGINGLGVVAILNFDATGAGTSGLNLNGVIWLNTSFENDSATSVPNIDLVNITITVSALETPDDTGGDIGDTGGGGGGGGGSGGASPIIVTNNSQNETDENNFGVVPEENNSFEENLEFENNQIETDDSRGFLPLTGKIIDGLKSGAIFSSWVFYFVLILAISFVAILLMKRLQSKKKPLEKQKISKY